MFIIINIYLLNDNHIFENIIDKLKINIIIY